MHGRLENGRTRVSNVAKLFTKKKIKTSLDNGGRLKNIIRSAVRAVRTVITVRDSDRNAPIMRGLRLETNATLPQGHRTYRPVNAFANVRLIIASKPYRHGTHTPTPQNRRSAEMHNEMHRYGRFNGGRCENALLMN